MDQTIVILALCFLQTTAFIPHNGKLDVVNVIDHQIADDSS
jgi:hypothetical protein